LKRRRRRRRRRRRVPWVQIAADVTEKRDVV
jgi:hypothetical protein